MFKRILVLLSALLVVFAGFEILKCVFPLKFSDCIMENAEHYGLDPTLISAQIKAESNFDTNALSKKGAVGVMQIMPETAQWCANKMGLSDFSLQDPETNIQIGCWYLRYLIGKTGDVSWALAAYNAGLTHAAEWKESGLDLTEIPFEETKTYLKKIKKFQHIYEYLYRKELS